MRIVCTVSPSFFRNVSDSFLGISPDTCHAVGQVVTSLLFPPFIKGTGQGDGLFFYEFFHKGRSFVYFVLYSTLLLLPPLCV
jgi:hypothetical protein